MKKLIPFLLILALALSLAACGGGEEAPAVGSAEAPAPAEQTGPTGPVGIWTLSESGDPDYAPGQITLVLDENGGGYQSITRFKDDFVYADYVELRWSEGAIVLDGVGGVFLQQDKSLTFTWNGVTSSYVYINAPTAPLTPPAGSYTSYAVYEEMETYPDSSFALSFNADGTGSYTGHGQTFPMTWNRYFLTVDGDQSFYFVYDGSQISVFDGEYQIILKAD